MGLENKDRHQSQLIIPELSKKSRLDKLLVDFEELNLSRSRIQKLMDSGEVLVNGQPVGHSYKVTGGETVLINIPPPEKTDLQPENIPIDVVYDDNDMLIVNKPVGMVTHPAAGHRTGTLVNAVMHHISELSSVDPDRPGIVHRLDKNTSGLIMIAKSDIVHRQLQTMLKDRKIEKIYHAIVCGHLKDKEGIIDLPIGRSLKNRKKMIVTNVKSREAITEYALIERFKLYDYIKVNLKTGRTHQIRVHLTHLGHPVLGDPDYGGREKWHRGTASYDKTIGQEALKIINRQALHAMSLKFVHPITGKEITVQSSFPDDFERLLDYLRTAR